MERKNDPLTKHKLNVGNSFEIIPILQANKFYKF